MAPRRYTVHDVNDSLTVWLRLTDDAQRRLRVLEARVIYTPLHRWMGACLMSANESARLGSVDVVRLNNALWRNARTHIAAHPDEDWRTAAGVSTPPRAR